MGRARESVGGQIRLGDRSYRVQRAGRSDVPAIVGLLSDEQIPCDGAELARYEEAYDAVARDPSHYLAVVRDEVGRIVGTMQLTIVPGLFRGGATRLLVEGIRVASSERSRGIGTAMHEPPDVKNYGPPGKGMKLRPGMVFAVEPMLNAGSPDTELLDDGWSVVTADGSLSAHWEHTIAITDDGPEILTVL